MLKRVSYVFKMKKKYAEAREKLDDMNRMTGPKRLSFPDPWLARNSRSRHSCGIETRRESYELRIAREKKVETKS